VDKSITYPAWAREIQTLLPACSHFLVSGNVRDYYFGPPETEGAPPLLVELPALVDRALAARGIRLVLSYEPTVGTTVLGSHDIGDEDVERLVGQPIEQAAGAGQLTQLLALVSSLAAAEEPVGLVIESASRLMRTPGELSEAEFSFFRGVDRVCRTAALRPTADGRLVHSPVVWIVDSDRDLPSWFTLRNEALRSISVPMPHSGEREQMATNLLPGLAQSSGFEGPLDRPIRVLTEQTAGMGLSAIKNIVRIARDQSLAPDRVDDAARSYRVGVVENPWQASFIASRLRAELADVPTGEKREAGQRARLEDRVLGQPDAVRKSLDILARSAAGLTAAQAGPTAARPRGVLFFAGPTGVGKTELAKAITKLLFDDERFYVRFDMSEFSAEHSADRLIGAPPGYVGHDAGGELTNAIRERPFSVVLFDEIEKAHERILDKFLQVLDDGRLTDGRGETVYFTEAVIVFTSNLGIYREVQDVSSGVAVTRRELAISRDTHPSAAERSEAIKQSIRDHFTLRLGRPELLNRIGDDNIVVFDFIDPETAKRILDGMLVNVGLRLEREHGFALNLTDDSVSRLDAACLSDEVLAMGGRGIGAKVETALINPVARLLTTTPPQAGGPVPPIELTEADDIWTARWT
jgi:energy-coupling factor transporter ATP-binding protein EcfA2